jgi:hypothetical protein
MSMTYSIGVFGPSHWSCMAEKLATGLARIVSQQRIEQNSIPSGVYTDAKEFFKLVREALQTGLSENPQASIKAFAIAAEVYRTVYSDALPPREDVKKSLEEYARFALSLSEVRELKPQELELAKSLQKFLEQLHHDGESEAYEIAVKQDEPLTL